MHFAGLDRLGLLGITSFGDTSSKVAAVTAAAGGKQATVINTSGASAGAPMVGSCTPDGQFIYDKTADGTIFTRRLRVGEVCSSTSGTNPTIIVHNEDTSLTITSPDGTVTQVPPVVNLMVSSRTMDAEALKRNIDQSQVNALNLKALIALGDLPPCPPESYHNAETSQPGTQNYACFYYTSSSLQPPLTFGLLDSVSFHIGELIQGKGFVRNWQPNDNDQFWVANSLRIQAIGGTGVGDVLKAISDVLLGPVGGILDLFDGANAYKGDLGKAWSDAILNLNNGWKTANGSEFYGNDAVHRLQNPSVGDFLALVPDARTSFPGLQWNPPQPTASMLNDAGGLLKWSKAGGFFMSYAMASGQIRWGDAFALGVNTLPLCACQTNVVETADRIANKVDTAINGIQAQAQFGWVLQDGSLSTAQGSNTDGGVAWETYIDIVTNPNVWHIEVRHQDKSWLEKVAQTLGNILQAIAQIFCNDPKFQQGINQLASTKCVDGKNKPCTKGKAGCTCTTAPASVQAGAALTSWYVSNWCSDFQNEIKQSTNPDFEQPVIPPAQVTTTIIPNWVIALSVVVGAGVLFKLKRKQGPDGKPVSLLPATTP